MSMVVLSLRMRIPKIVITAGPANVIRLEKVEKAVQAFAFSVQICDKCEKNTFSLYLICRVPPGILITALTVSSRRSHDFSVPAWYFIGQVVMRWCHWFNSIPVLRTAMTKPRECNDRQNRK